jgi:hypothetical protein
MHPDGGIGFSGQDQFNHNRKIQLLDWAGLVSQFSEEPEKQNASLSTRVPPSGDIPEIVFAQYWSDMKMEQPTRRFGFTHVPPIFNTTISRSFSEKDGGSISLPGASVGLLPGETRRLDLGPLTEQQREELEQMRQRFQKKAGKREAERQPARVEDAMPLPQDTKAGEAANAMVEKKAVESAESWLVLVDQGQYEQSWNAAAEYLKIAVDKTDFAKGLKGARSPLGEVKSRELASKQYVTHLPVAPDGQYVILQYKTSFANKESATETITPMLDKDGKWKVSGYYVK